MPSTWKWKWCHQPACSQNQWQTFATKSLTSFFDALCSGSCPTALPAPTFLLHHHGKMNGSTAGNRPALRDGVEASHAQNNSFQESRWSLLDWHGVPSTLCSMPKHTIDTSPPFCLGGGYKLGLKIKYGLLPFLSGIKKTSKRKKDLMTYL